MSAYVTDDTESNDAPADGALATALPTNFVERACGQEGETCTIYALTGTGESSTESDEIRGGVDSIQEDPRLEQAFALIRAVISDADKRAADEIVARISSGRTTPQATPSYISPDKRAPHGSSARLIDRALEEAGENGLTVAGILAKAETEFERMVSASAIRNWLKENERKRPPRYRQVAGVWYLPSRAPTVKAVS